MNEERNEKINEDLKDILYKLHEKFHIVEMVLMELMHFELQTLFERRKQNLSTENDIELNSRISLLLDWYNELSFNNDSYRIDFNKIFGKYTNSRKVQSWREIIKKLQESKFYKKGGDKNGNIKQDTK